MSPSFMRMSTTDESRPPKCAGKLPLYRVTFFNASGLKTEKKPIAWLTLYTGTPSSKSRFSSGPPPRTYMPAEPSEPFCTPGSSWMAFSTSASPKRVGMLLICCTGSSTTLICGLRALTVARVPSTTTSSKVVLVSSKKLRLRFSFKSRERLCWV